MTTAKSVRPLPGYITLKLIEAETKTAAGLILPDSSQEKPQMGKVLAIGRIFREIMKVDTSFETSKMLAIESEIKVGDTVLFKKYTGNPVKVNNEEVQLVEFQNLMGVLE